MSKQVIAGVAVAPGQVVCGVSIGPTQDTITLCLSTATGEQLRAAARAIDEELDRRAAIVMSELEDSDSLLNQGLADALDARELDVVEVRPVGKSSIRKCRQCGDEYATLNRIDLDHLCWDCHCRRAHHGPS